MVLVKQVKPVICARKSGGQALWPRRSSRCSKIGTSKASKARNWSTWEQRQLRRRPKHIGTSKASKASKTSTWSTWSCDSSAGRRSFLRNLLALLALLVPILLQLELRRRHNAWPPLFLELLTGFTCFTSTNFTAPGASPAP